jgi:predicted Zn-dependent protease
MIIALFRDRGTLAEIALVKNAIESCYGPYGLKVQDRGYLYVPGAGPKLNAAKLLLHLNRVSDSGLSLWIVDRGIFYPDSGDIFGCAARRSALISKEGLDLELLAKEVLHEIGHLLGLDHCHDHCIMSLSKSLDQARAKPSNLCSGCASKLNSARKEQEA